MDRQEPALGSSAAIETMNEKNFRSRWNGCQTPELADLGHYR
jgi:hypothetical protein